MSPALWDPHTLPWYLVGVGVLCIIFGLLIPRRTYVRENDYLRRALDKRDEQVNKLIKQNDVIISLLEDIKAAGHRRTANRDV